ncbi:polysaccharide deacetylase family protein [Paeniglutamicibacter kerguelensis]|uniref:Peptidoglycan/xylan/chitin deacetylase (PgdA/CDA1 family) n=1 Tax=Paeniglutamicibacter kerguelensis TaxID=254788 RepID=A0ABS4XFC7_9MICC|nr:polysaccharide deacetylase family protein [Paeniglutamicibacter kerguelensis]MBP2387171.1 peptidoglycan/xylan/chitin deacetylase (PgdA/CDA1 family) [Paeniglutamicibacter kerguelensis]
MPLLLVPDLNTVEQSDEHRHIFSRHFEVPSVPSVGEAQRGLVESHLDEFNRNNIPDVYAGSAATGELNLRSYLTAVSQHVIGIRTAVYEFAGASGGSSFVTQWFDTRTPGLLDSRDLFDSDDDWAEFREFVAQSATSDPEVVPESVTQLEDSWLDSVNFDAQGNATIEFDDYTIAPGSAGSIVVTVPAANIVPLLSPFGQMARTAAMNPVPRISAGLWGSARPGEPTQTTQVPGTEQRREPRNIDCSKTKCVALTFDDGPGPKTGKLLDELKKKNAAATFFVVGPNAKTRPELIERMIAEGHEVGNHTWSHRSLPALSPAQVRSEIDRTNEAISAAIDQPATLLRPPYGARNPTIDRLAQAPVILWDVDTLDWKHKNTGKVVDAAVSQTKPGSIVLMHDIHGSTVAAVPEILSRLKAKGYTFVTVTELLGKDKLNSGEAYSRTPLPTAGRSGTDEKK